MIDSPAVGADFFVAGGTLRPTSESYVNRAADDDLHRYLRAGDFCYVLTSRQMGKSSLMMKTARRLKEEGVRTAIIDLTRVGTVAVDQWYLGLLMLMKRQLRLRADPEQWWAEHASLGAVQRFTDFIHDVVLTELEENVVIFIDEIDSTLNLDFTDDFFAAMRAIYNARTEDPNFNRLTFVLFGVATPSDLIKDRSRTPFNVGRGIALKDFDRADAAVLQHGMEAIFGNGRGTRIFERIFYWTNGHPYLTQKLCLSVAEKSGEDWGDAQVDALVQRLFLSESEEARGETNLKFIRENIATNAERASLLKLYRQVYQGKSVPDDDRSPEQNRLKLLGLVRARNGVLQVRNNIYREAFNQAWIKANLPADRTRQIAIAATAVAVLLLLVLGLFVWQQGQRTTEALAQTYIEDFNRTTNPTLRLGALAALFKVPGYQSQARDFYASLPPEEQDALFENVTPDLQEQLRTVARNIYIDMPDNERGNEQLQIMHDALTGSDSAESEIMANEINSWLEGRRALQSEEYRAAEIAYGVAVGLNGKNPATVFERAQIQIILGNYTYALTDLSTAVSLNADWAARVKETIETVPALHSAAWEQRSAYPAIASIISQPPDTATPVATFTPIPPSDTPAVAQVAATASNTPSPSPAPTETATQPAATGAATPTVVASETSATATASATPEPPPPTQPPPPATLAPAVSQSPSQIYQLAFTRWDGVKHNLYVSDTNGGEPRLLLERAAGPSWSTDGGNLYFYGEAGVDRQTMGAGRSFEGISNGLVRINANPLPTTLGQVQMFQPGNWKVGTARSTSAAPDGAKVAYEAQPGGSYRIYYIDANGNETLPFEIDGEQVGWSPDGERIVYRSGRGGMAGLWISSWADSGHTNITTNGSDSFPAWSPDGQRIAFSREEDGNLDIYTMNIDGTNVQRLTDAPGQDTLPLYTPDGQIIFRSARSGAWAIWKMDGRGGNQTEIIPDAGVGPDWASSRMDVR